MVRSLDYLALHWLIALSLFAALPETFGPNDCRTCRIRMLTRAQPLRLRPRYTQTPISLASIIVGEDVHMPVSCGTVQLWEGGTISCLLAGLHQVHSIFGIPVYHPHLPASLYYSSNGLVPKKSSNHNLSCDSLCSLFYLDLLWLSPSGFSSIRQNKIQIASPREPLKPQPLRTFLSWLTFRNMSIVDLASELLLQGPSNLDPTHSFCL